MKVCRPVCLPGTAPASNDRVLVVGDPQPTYRWIHRGARTQVSQQNLLAVKTKAQTCSILSEQILGHVWILFLPIHKDGHSNILLYFFLSSYALLFVIHNCYATFLPMSSSYNHFCCVGMVYSDISNNKYFKFVFLLRGRTAVSGYGTID